MLQQQSPLSQARELEAELPEQGQVAHGEHGAGRREKREHGRVGWEDGVQEEKVSQTEAEQNRDSNS